MCVYVYLSAVAWGGQKGPWDPLELGLQAIVSGLTWAQGDKLYSSEFQRWMGAISPTPKAFFFNGGNFMIYITNTIYISKQDTGMGLTIHSAFCVLLFIFGFTFCRLYSWRISSTYAMKYDHIRPSPSLPPTSLQPQSPHLPPNFLHSFKNIQCWPYVDGCEANPRSMGNSPQ